MKRSTTNRFHKNYNKLSKKVGSILSVHFILLPSVILQVILYSMFHFICYTLANLCKRDLVLKTVSIEYLNIRESQPENGLKWKVETCSYHYLVNII